MNKISAKHKPGKTQFVPELIHEATRAHNMITGLDNLKKVRSQCTGNPVVYQADPRHKTAEHVRWYGTFVASFCALEDLTLGWKIRFRRKWITALPETIEFINSLPLLED
jgi:hypothetical protein